MWSRSFHLTLPPDPPIFPAAEFRLPARVPPDTRPAALPTYRALRSLDLECPALTLPLHTADDPLGCLPMAPPYTAYTNRLNALSGNILSEYFCGIPQNGFLSVYQSVYFY